MFAFNRLVLRGTATLHHSTTSTFQSHVARKPTTLHIHLQPIIRCGMSNLMSLLFFFNCSSMNEVICHGIPDGRELEDGDICNGEAITLHELV